MSNKHKSLKKKENCDSNLKTDQSKKPDKPKPKSWMSNIIFEWMLYSDNWNM